MLIQTHDTKVIRFIGICDPHFSGVDPAAWKLPYFDTMVAALQSIFDFGQREGVDAYLWAGDIFNLKSPLRNSLWFLSDLIDVLKSAGAPHLGIAGNHDVKYGSLVGLKGQPLELLCSAGVFHLLDKDPVRVQNYQNSVRVSGASYELSIADGLLALPHGPEDVSIGLAHLWFAPTSGTAFGEPTWGPDVLGKANVDVMLIGHHHEEQGVIETSGKMYLAPGSFTRTGMHEHDLKRIPAAVYIQIEGTKVTAMLLRPRFPEPQDHLDLSRREELVSHRLDAEAFTEALNEINNSAGADPLAILKDMDVTEEVRRRVEEYLEAAEATH